jgi:tetraacyldisaccharide 4'-kinase
MLRGAGERPVILSRGYARTDHSSTPVIVSDGQRVLEPVARSGDEPQMLARNLTGVPVVVGANRFAAGRLAQSRFDVTVFVLDDGFQHVQLARDVDLLVVGRDDLADRVLPAGRLREPLAAAATADALLVYGDEAEARRVSTAVGVAMAFTVDRHYEPPRLVSAPGTPLAGHGRRVVAFAGIARPERFFAAVRAHGWDLAHELRFSDHRWFTAADIDRIASAARAAGADLILTTEKDAVRLPELPAGVPPVAFVPMRVSVAPPAAFLQWLRERMAPGVISR